MGRKTEDVEIDGIQLRTQQLPAMEGFELYFDVVKNAPVLLGNVDPAMMATMDPKAVSAMMLKMMRGTYAIVSGPDGQPRRVELLSRESINQVFDGKLWALFQAMAHAAKVNFADFPKGSGLGAPAPAAT